MSNVVVIGGGVSFLHAIQDCMKQKCTVTAIMGNPFLEWSLASTHCLVRSERHADYLSPNPDEFKVKGVNYVFEPASKVDPVAKQVTTTKGTGITYDYLVVATGFSCPYFIPTPGHTLAERMDEVEKCAKAIKAANTIVVNGAGAIGLEFAGDIRAAYSNKEIIVLSRDGKVASAFPPSVQEKAKTVLEQRNIRVVTGRVAGDMMTPKLEAGTLQLEGGTQNINYDVYMPSFTQGPNTSFLQDAENALDQKGMVKVNDFLQSIAYPEIFAISVGDKCPRDGALIMQVTEQAATVAKNIGLLAAGKPLAMHKPTGKPGQAPPALKIGQGKGGWAYLDTTVFPAPIQCCCCLPCKGGYPCCPCICCWCCGTGCSKMFGTCGAPPEGEGVAIFLHETAAKKFPSMHGMKGLGKKPEQQTM